MPQATRMQTSWVDFLHWTPSCLPLVSGVRCWLPLSVVPRQLCLLASLLSNANCPRPGPPSTASLLSRRQLSFTSPSHFGYVEISCPRILCLISRQNRQRNRLLWRPTHIVLHLLTKPLGIVPIPPVTTGITITFHRFFSSLARSQYLSLFLFSLQFSGKVSVVVSLFCFCFSSLERSQYSSLFVFVSVLWQGLSRCLSFLFLF